MDGQTEQWIRDTLGPAHRFYTGDEEREKAADTRTEAIIRAIREESKKQTDAIDRLTRTLVDALRVLDRR